MTRFPKTRCCECGKLVATRANGDLAVHGSGKGCLGMRAGHRIITARNESPEAAEAYAYLLEYWNR